MTDLSHLNAIEHRLSLQRGYASSDKTSKAREWRAVQISQIEKELAAKRKFLGLTETLDDILLSDDELLAELQG